MERILERFLRLLEMYDEEGTGNDENGVKVKEGDEVKEYWSKEKEVK